MRIPRGHVWVLSIMLLVALAGAAILAYRTSEGINVILITVDTLRADHLGAYGYPRDTSPNLDAFAKESILFLKAFSQSSETNPSLSSLMTSYLPTETRVLNNRFALQDGAVTLAELLRTRGYRTGAVVSNFSLRQGSGFEQGFDAYDDKVTDRHQTEWEGLERFAPNTTKAALRWLEANGGSKFFLWVHYMDPHYPYLPPPPYNTMFTDAPLGEDKWLPFNEEGTGLGGIHSAAQLGERHELQFYVSQYDGEVRFFDQYLGELLQTIRAKGLMKNTLVILAADHGEGMGEHNYYFAHHEFLYQSVIHVPLLVRFPDQRLGGHSMSYPVANTDIVPTVLETLGMDVPNTMRGRNLLSPGDRNIYAMASYRRRKSALIAGDRKLIEDADRTQFYDLARDASEQRNLAETDPDGDFTAAAKLKQRLAELENEDRLALGVPGEWNIDEGSTRKLKALGYVQ